MEGEGDMVSTRVESQLAQSDRSSGVEQRAWTTELDTLDSCVHHTAMPGEQGQVLLAQWGTSVSLYRMHYV